MFEKFKKDADDSYRDIENQIFTPVYKAHQQMLFFYEDLGNLLVKTGWIKKEKANDIIHMVGVVNRKSIEIKNLRTGYIMQGKEANYLEQAIKFVMDGIFADSQNKEEISKILKVSYLDQKNVSIKDIQTTLGLDNETMLRLRIKQLLIEGKTPGQIAEVLKIDESKINNIQQSLEKLEDYKQIAT